VRRVVSDAHNQGNRIMINPMPTIKIFCAAVALSAAMLTNGDLTVLSSGKGISQADARVGRPLTPRSGAGVVRRATPGVGVGAVRVTTRRVVRTSVYVTTLPKACASVHINGVSYWHCSGVYYQPSGGRYVRVTVH